MFSTDSLRKGKYAFGRSSSSASPQAKVPSSDEVEAIVSQVAELRAQRKYRAAVSLLRGALAEGWDGPVPGQAGRKHNSI